MNTSRDSNCQHPLAHRKSKRIPEKYLLLCQLRQSHCMNHNKLWKILQQMGIPDHLNCLLRNLYAGQEVKVRTKHGAMDLFQIGKRVHQGCILSSVYLTSLQSTSCKMMGWMKHKLESRLLREISITSDMQIIPPLWKKVNN